MTVDTKLDVRPYVKADETDVVALLRASLGEGPTGQRTAQFFRWKHHLNPFGRSYMLVADAGGRIVGFRAFMRWRFVAADRVWSAVRAVDTATHPAFQGRGIFRRLTLAALDDLKGSVDLVFNTPNAKSGPGYLTMGWERVGEIPVRVRVQHPIRFLRTARRRASPVARPAPTVDAERASRVIGWDDRSIAAGDRLCTPRTSDYLRWRYAEMPTLDYRVVRAGEGYAVFRVRPRGASWEAAIAELFADDAETARDLLRSVRRSVGVDHVTCSLPLGTVAAASARRAGFLPSPKGPTLMVNALAPVHPDVTSLSSWALTLGDVELF